MRGISGYEARRLGDCELTTLLWTLILIQIAMGAFDTLFHHEFMERLAWRKSQQKELKLHAIRNLFYAIVFAVVGFFTINGVFAYALIALLMIELFITLSDFVEEDRSRKLPASERVTHTLMALNYGAILVLLIPILLNWGQQNTALVPVDYGLIKYIMGFAAIAVVVFGCRDWFAAQRLAHLPIRAGSELVGDNILTQHFLVTGGTGFVGRRLVNALSQAGHQVTVLTRELKSATHLKAPIQIITDLDQIPSGAQVDAIVNLAGHPIASGLWTGKHRRKVMRSRLKMSRKLRKLCVRLRSKPSVFISASAIGVYGISQNTEVDETHTIVDDGSFSRRSCARVEAEALKMKSLGIRTINLRIGLVLDPDGGPLGQMIVPFDLGLGGPFGKGQHWMSWISRDDLVRLVIHCINEKSIDGAVNATTINPVQNKDYAKALGRALYRPAIIPLPAFVLKLGLRDFAKEIFLGSQNVVPTKALQSGFTFETPEINQALKRMLGRSGSAREKTMVSLPEKTASFQ